MASKKKNFAYFAWKLKILSHKNAIKALYFRFGGEKSCKFLNFLWKSARFFQKTWFLSNFGPHFRFLWPNFATFCHKAREAFENFEKSTSVSSFFSNFAIFGPHFHQLFATRRVKPWKIWKNSWLPAEIELLPVEIPRKLVIFWKQETEIGFFWQK